MARLRIKSVDLNGVRVNVTISGGRKNEAYKLWVAMKSHSNGDLVGAEYLPIGWDQQDEFPTTGSAGDFHPLGERQEIYVWKHPDTQTPLPVDD